MSIDPLMSYRGLIVARLCRKIRAKSYKGYFQPTGLVKIEGFLDSKNGGLSVLFFTARTLLRAL